MKHILFLVASLAMSGCMDRETQEVQLKVTGWNQRDKSIEFKIDKPKTDNDIVRKYYGCTKGTYTSEQAYKMRSNNLVVNAEVSHGPTGLAVYCKILNEDRLK